MMRTVRILSGGAAQGLVKALERPLADRGIATSGHFGAVGAMRDKLLGGEPCDLVILTSALVAELESQGHVLPGSATPLGRVRTGVAVKRGTPLPPVGDAGSLARLLRGARGIYFPDPEKATAGIHFMKVLRTLGLDQELAPRLRTFPNGATAMRELAACDEPDLVGCTQFTEILYTPGVQLAGALPQEFELATMYTAGVCTRGTAPDAAAVVAALLASDEARALREGGGFDPLP